MVPTKSTTDANGWLDKAIKLESEGKLSMAEKALERACRMEVEENANQTK